MTKVLKPDELAKQGLQLAEVFPGIGLGVRSLTLAIRAFSETYAAIRHVSHLFVKDEEEAPNVLELNNSRDTALRNSFEYQSACFQTIAFFQHFIELELKSILRAEHPLLAVDSQRKHIVLHKLIKGEELQEREWMTTNSIEFAATLDRVCTLIGDNRLDQSLSFVAENREALKQLNIIRNRMWHRGTFILRYDALDQFLIYWIIPFIEQLREYRGLGHGSWSRELACGLDPISKIIEDGQKKRYQPRKIALLKEMCRASFHIPFSLSGDSIFDGPLANLARHGETIGWDAKVCPVCGGKSLVLYHDEAYSDEDGSPVQIVVSAICFACTLELDLDLGNPSDHGFEIEDILW